MIFISFYLNVSYKCGHSRETATDPRRHGEKKLLHDDDDDVFMKVVVKHKKLKH